MSLSNGKGSVSTAISSASWKTRGGGDAVSEQFPAGLRVLVVDDDPTCLMILEKMLRTCLYEVTKCNRAEMALSLLRDNKNGYDVVISDVHMPDMDGFKLLEHIGLEMDLPVIMMSADDGKDVVMKGVTHGACDYLIKPVRIEALKNIWQHVIRKKKLDWKDYEQSGSAEEGGSLQKQPDYAEYSSSANEGNWKSTKRRKDDEEDVEERDDSSTLKKPRVVWSVELHQQFVAAVNQLGIDKAVPKKILELMNVPGLTRENVASHLQKYRLYLRRLSGVSQHHSNINNSFIGPQDLSYGHLSSISGLDLQTLAATGQISAQSLATLQAAGLGRTIAKSRVPVSVVDQRNLFSFENPKLRFGDEQQQSQQQHSSSSKQMNLLHGIPMNMEPKQLAHLHHSAQSLGTLNIPINTNGMQSNPNLLLMQMSLPQTREQILNESTTNHVSRIPSSMGLPITTNTVSGAVLPKSGLPENPRGTGHSPVPQSNSYNFPLNGSEELVGSSFTVASTAGMSTVTSNRSFQEDLSTEIKGPAAFMPNYDMFNDFQLHKPNEWELQNIGLPLSTPQQTNLLQSNLDMGPSVFAHQGFSSSQSKGGSGNLPEVSKPIYASRDTLEQMSARSAGQHSNTIYGENPIRVKAESVSEAYSQPTIFHEQHCQEDLMSALLKQQQGGVVPAETEFDFDIPSIDNIPV